MSNILQDSNAFSVPIPITQEALSMAQQFANEQPTPEKRRQVQMNTLAVWAVNDYLKLMGIATDLAAGDSWQPVPRFCADVADLQLPGLGRLECRPMTEQAMFCSVPPEVWSDPLEPALSRIGYVVVQLEDSLQFASILGFARRVETERLLLQQLRSPEELLEYLYQLGHPLTQLSEWVQGIFQPHWQVLEAIFSPPELNLAFREAGSSETERRLRRARLLDLGIQLQDHPVALVMEIQPAADQQTQIQIQVRPRGEEFLPPDLQLFVLDESGARFLEARSRNADNYIQLQFSGASGERFSICVALGDSEITEAFIF